MIIQYVLGSLETFWKQTIAESRNRKRRKKPKIDFVAGWLKRRGARGLHTVSDLETIRLVRFRDKWNHYSTAAREKYF